MGCNTSQEQNTTQEDENAAAEANRDQTKNGSIPEGKQNCIYFPLHLIGFD